MLCNPFKITDRGGIVKIHIDSPVILKEFVDSFFIEVALFDKA